jgi:DNA-directed RNA polymerase specialized sigma subunit
MNHDTLPLDNIPEPFDPAPNPEALAIHQQTTAHIRTLFSRLFSVRDTAVLSALYVDDRTALETARQLGLSERQIVRIRHNALKILRKNAEIRALLSSTAT